MNLKKLVSISLSALLLSSALSACSEKTLQVSSSQSQPDSSQVVSSTAPQPTAMAKARPETLSEDIYSFQLQIDGDIYAFPMPYEDFLGYGWEYDEDDTLMLDSQRVQSVEVFSKGNLTCFASFVNFDVNAVPLRNAYIGGISIDSFAVGSTGAEIVAPGGLVFGKSTSEEIRAAYGTPTYENKSEDGSEILKYEQESNQSYEFWVDGETGVMSQISLRNTAQPEDFKPGEVSTEVPSIVTQYQTPKKMSNKFEDWIVEYDGVL